MDISSENGPIGLDVVWMLVGAIEELSERLEKVSGRLEQLEKDATKVRKRHDHEGMV